MEITLFDCARYFHKASGSSGVAQIAKDIGDEAEPNAQDARLAIEFEVENLVDCRVAASDPRNACRQQ